MPTYRVLSIDGGGIRGLVTTVLLQRILAHPGSIASWTLSIWLQGLPPEDCLLWESPTRLIWPKSALSTSTKGLRSSTTPGSTTLST